MKGVMFTDLPEPSRAKYDWESVANALRERPGEWACVIENAPVSVTNSVLNGVKALPRDQFEIRMRNTHRDQWGNKKCDLYIRYDPENQPKRKKK